MLSWGRTGIDTRRLQINILFCQESTLPSNFFPNNLSAIQSNFLVPKLNSSLIEKKMLHRPGIEPGPPAWQASILPLNQRCYFAILAILNHVYFLFKSVLPNAKICRLSTQPFKSQKAMLSSLLFEN